MGVGAVTVALFRSIGGRMFWGFRGSVRSSSVRKSWRFGRGSCEQPSFDTRRRAFSATCLCTTPPPVHAKRLPILSLTTRYWV